MVTRHLTLGIDPGDRLSAYALIDTSTRHPVQVGKVANDELRDWVLRDDRLLTARTGIEMVASYGMPVGREVFETCVWIGRYIEAFTQRGAAAPEMVYRREVKLHHCHSPRANDATIRQALVDRFTPGQANHGKGTKKQPGWFYSFRADIWQAYALAVYIADETADQDVAATPIWT